MYLPEPTGSDFAPPPAGTHAAICYRFIDLGTQMIEWQGKAKTQRKVLISWELPTELMEDGKPFVIGRRYTWSMSEKSSLRHDLESWRGRAFTSDDFKGPNRFNIANILGKPCLITVVHDSKDNGDTYANIKGVTAMPKGMPAPQAVNEPVYFSLEKDLFRADVLDTFSDKLKETIKASPEYRELFMKPSGSSDEPIPSPDDYGAFDDRVPF